MASVETCIKRSVKANIHPGPCTKSPWPVFWLAVILFSPAFPCVMHSGVGQNRQAYSSGVCAGIVEMDLPFTGFPFHPPAELPEDTIAL
jgi:hypothetical protein